MLAQNKCVQVDHKIHLARRQAVSNHQSCQAQHSFPTGRQRILEKKWELFMGAMTGTWCVQDQQPYKVSYEVSCAPAFANNYHPFLTLKFIFSGAAGSEQRVYVPWQTFPLTSPLKVVPSVSGNQEKSSATLRPRRVNFSPRSCCYGQKGQCVCYSPTAAPSTLPASRPTAHQPTPTSVLHWHGKGCTLMGIICKYKLGKDQASSWDRAWDLWEKQAVTGS